MFDFVRSHTRLFQFLLLILILPSFVALGVNGYSRFMDGSNAAVASVDGHKITQAEWDAAHREQTERARRQAPTLDPKQFDTPEARRETLEGLLREKVLQAAVRDQRLLITDERLAEVFRTDPQFAFLRNPDGTPNKAMLAAQGMNSDMLAYRLRQDLALRQVTQGMLETGVSLQASALLAFDALLQQREVQVLRFDSKAFASKIEPSDSEVEAFYKQPANSARFQLPESTEIEYVVLDIDALKAAQTVSDKDLHDYYEQNQSRFTVAEERRASHILIKADKGAPAPERAKAKERADSLLAELRKTPSAFAELAKKNSQDEGSASRGGDLDYFPRGAMVKPFEDAAYALKQGEISPVIESEFGFHIIQLTGIRGGERKAFDAMRAEIELEVRKQKAQAAYAGLAEQFGNIVYEQSDSLKPVADKLKLSIQKASVQRKPQPGAQGALASPKLLEAIFGTDALRNKRNTEAIETGPNQLVSARVIDYKPVRLPEFAAVKSAVREQLVRKLAAEQAVKAGQARLAELQKSGAVSEFESIGLVSRFKPNKLPPKALDAAMHADVSKLPALVGVDNGDDGFLIVAVTKLEARDPALADNKRLAQQYAQAWAGAEAAAFYNALKSQHKAALSVPAAASGVAP